jgi:hypothetical protein
MTERTRSVIGSTLSPRVFARMALVLAIVTLSIACTGPQPPAASSGSTSATVVSASPPAASTSASTAPSASTVGSTSSYRAPRHLDDIVFKQVPAWLVPAGGTAGVSAYGDDGTWSTTYDVPREAGTVLAEYAALIAAHDIEVTKSGALPDPLQLRSRNVLPSVLIIVAPKNGASEVTVSFNRNEP